MRHAQAVCFVQSIRDLGRDPQRFRNWHRTLLQSLRNGLALDVLHDEESIPPSRPRSYNVQM